MMMPWVVCRAVATAAGTANERPVAGMTTTSEDDLLRFPSDSVDDPVAVLLLPNVDDRRRSLLQPLAATDPVESESLIPILDWRRSSAGRPVGRSTTTSQADHPRLDDVQDTVLVRRKTNDRRSLQSPPPTTGLVDSTSIIILPESSSLLLTPIKLVISEVPPQPPRSNGTTTTYYLSLITDLLFDSSGSQLYYALNERGIEVFTDPDKSLNYKNTWLSFRKADLRPIKQGLADHVAGELISHWWPQSSPNGTRVDFPEECNDTRPFCHMTFIEGIELPKDGTHLMISSRTKPPYLVYLSIADGSRTSIPIATSYLQTLALNPPKTTLYVTNEQRLLSIDVAETGIPTGGSGAATFATYHPPPIVGGLDPLQISPQSFVANGTCLYTLDNTHRRLLAVEIPTSSYPSSSSSSSSSLGSRPSFTVLVDGLNLNKTVFMQTLVATPDGCNVFITDVGRDGGSGYLRWVKVESACQPGGTIHTVAHSPDGSMWGLSLQEEGGRMYLYVGTGKGEVYQLELDKSQLYSCAPFPPNSSSAFPPNSSSSFPPNSSFSFPPNSSSSFPANLSSSFPPSGAPLHAGDIGSAAPGLGVSASLPASDRLTATGRSEGATQLVYSANPSNSASSALHPHSLIVSLLFLCTTTIAAMLALLS
ncbi:hypothetical protein CBR_g81514 [Chara braunii]|uniref:Uncharacterized protein n=1 Tax=Chara braunii TaxID=69332 RepID=A0A388JL09_CHABU|nr:hypothetical protein CBR_g81514 [Chara braunii]|eukprot:GBG47878.1 hypothetical protein CBR_g81514 [Chara braunii]